VSGWLSKAYGVALVVVLAYFATPIGGGGKWGKVVGAIAHTAHSRALLPLIIPFPDSNNLPRAATDTSQLDPSRWTAPLSQPFPIVELSTKSQPILETRNTPHR
jgi:hypothetical protein